MFRGRGKLTCPRKILAETYATPASYLEAIATAWASITGSGTATITVLSASEIRIEVPLSGTVARLIRIEHSTSPGDGTTAAAMINPAAAVLTGQLTQVPSAEDQPPRFTAQFPIGVIRDMVPDAG